MLLVLLLLQVGSAAGGVNVDTVVGGVGFDTTVDAVGGVSAVDGVSFDAIDKKRFL